MGPARLAVLAAAFPTLEEAWAATAEELAVLPGWPSTLAAGVQRFRLAWGEEPLEMLRRRGETGRGVLLPGDPRWPEGMAALARPPLALRWRGRGSLWPVLARRQAVAVVGTRRPSLHGLAMARQLGMALAEAGWPVVSGLAEGIDGAAHEGCLEAAGAPVGVLGTPLERTYPRHHVHLQQRVAAGGLLVSEQPKGSSVRACHFASRNRLQVALAAAVVVVECPRSSGALHSAELAWAEGLPLWVVPADAGKPSAEGSNALLARGATPLLAPGDLVASLGEGPLARRRPPSRGGLPPPARPQPGRPHPLLAVVGSGASLDQLSRCLQRPPQELAAELLELELAGLLRAEPGLRWSPCGDQRQGPA